MPYCLSGVLFYGVFLVLSQRIIIADINSPEIKAEVILCCHKCLIASLLLVSLSLNVLMTRQVVVSWFHFIFIMDLSKIKLFTPKKEYIC